MVTQFAKHDYALILARSRPIQVALPGYEGWELERREGSDSTLFETSIFHNYDSSFIGN